MILLSSLPKSYKMLVIMLLVRKTTMTMYEVPTAHLDEATNSLSHSDQVPTIKSKLDRGRTRHKEMDKYSQSRHRKMWNVITIISRDI